MLLHNVMDVGALNYLFFAEFEPLNYTFSCRFVGRYYENKSCEITYGAVDPTDQSCRMDNHITRRVNSSFVISDTVTIVLPGLEHTDSGYCFTAVGKTVMFTAAVEGTFKIGIICLYKLRQYI